MVDGPQKGWTHAPVPDDKSLPDESARIKGKVLGWKSAGDAGRDLMYKHKRLVRSDFARRGNITRHDIETATGLFRPPVGIYSSPSRTVFITGRETATDEHHFELMAGADLGFSKEYDNYWGGTRDNTTSTSVLRMVMRGDQIEYLLARPYEIETPVFGGIFYVTNVGYKIYRRIEGEDVWNEVCDFNLDADDLYLGSGSRWMVSDFNVCSGNNVEDNFPTWPADGADVLYVSIAISTGHAELWMSYDNGVTWQIFSDRVERADHGQTAVILPMHSPFGYWLGAFCVQKDASLDIYAWDTWSVSPDNNQQELKAYGPVETLTGNFGPTGDRYYGARLPVAMLFGCSGKASETGDDESPGDATYTFEDLHLAAAHGTGNGEFGLHICDLWGEKRYLRVGTIGRWASGITAIGHRVYTAWAGESGPIFISVNSLVTASRRPDYYEINEYEGYWETPFTVPANVGYRGGLSSYGRRLVLNYSEIVEETLGEITVVFGVAVSSEIDDEKILEELPEEPTWDLHEIERITMPREDGPSMRYAKTSDNEPAHSGLWPCWTSCIDPNLPGRIEPTSPRPQRGVAIATVHPATETDDGADNGPGISFQCATDAGKVEAFINGVSVGQWATADRVFDDPAVTSFGIHEHVINELFVNQGGRANARLTIKTMSLSEMPGGDDILRVAEFYVGMPVGWEEIEEWTNGYGHSESLVEITCAFTDQSGNSTVALDVPTLRSLLPGGAGGGSGFAGTLPASVLGNVITPDMSLGTWDYYREFYGEDGLGYDRVISTVSTTGIDPGCPPDPITNTDFPGTNPSKSWLIMEQREVDEADRYNFWLDPTVWDLVSTYSMRKVYGPWLDMGPSSLRNYISVSVKWDAIVNALISPTGERGIFDGLILHFGIFNADTGALVQAFTQRSYVGAGGANSPTASNLDVWEFNDTVEVLSLPPRWVFGVYPEVTVSSVGLAHVWIFPAYDSFFSSAFSASIYPLYRSAGYESWPYSFTVTDISDVCEAISGSWNLFPMVENNNSVFLTVIGDTVDLQSRMELVIVDKNLVEQIFTLSTTTFRGRAITGFDLGDYESLAAMSNNLLYGSQKSAEIRHYPYYDAPNKDIYNTQSLKIILRPTYDSYTTTLGRVQWLGDWQNRVVIGQSPTEETMIDLEQAVGSYNSGDGNWQGSNPMGDTYSRPKAIHDPWAAGVYKPSSFMELMAGGKDLLRDDALANSVGLRIEGVINFRYTYHWKQLPAGIANDQYSGPGYPMDVYFGIVRFEPNSPDEYYIDKILGQLQLEPKGRYYEDHINNGTDPGDPLDDTMGYKSMHIEGGAYDWGSTFAPPGDPDSWAFGFFYQWGEYPGAPPLQSFSALSTGLELFAELTHFDLQVRLHHK